MADAIVRVSDSSTQVIISGSELIGPLVVAAAASAADAAASATAAELARDVATTGIGHPVYASIAAGEAATATGDPFIVDTGLGTFEYRIRTVSGSDPQFDYIGAPTRYQTVTDRGEMFQVPLYTPVTDVIGIGGQSNTVANGGSAALSPSSVQYEWDGSNLITLADPMANNANPSGGSEWPAFANEYASVTGRRVVIAAAGVASTALLAAADTGAGNWSPTGTLRAALVAKMQAAIAAVQASPDHRMGNVVVNWGQGERDGSALFAGTAGVSSANYRDALVALFDWILSQIPTLSAFNVIRTGSHNVRSEAGAWAQIRQAEEDACALRPQMRIVYRGTTSFPTDGLNIMFDDLHYNQIGLNLAGTCAAIEAAAAVPSAIPLAPAILAKTSLFDTDLVTAASSRTDSHTTAPLTKMLVVGVAAMKRSSAANNPTTSVTFNGVAMKPLSPATSGNNTVTGASGQVNISWWGLTQTQYGSSLSSATQNIVTTQTGLADLIDLFIYDLDSEAIMEAGPNDRKIASGTGTVYTAGIATFAPGDGLTTGAPALVLGLAGTVGAGAAKMTHTWAGLIEDYDDGQSDGTRAVQATAASEVFASDLTQHAITVTSSGTTGGALLVCALRGRVAGEEGF